MPEFRWPDELFSLSFSGGRTSGYMLVRLIELAGPVPDRGVVSFQNTGKEHPATLEFVRRVAEYTETDVRWLEFYQDRKYHPLARLTSYDNASRSGEPFVMAMEWESGWLPNQHRRWCTKKMKFETLKRHLLSLGWRRWENLIGIRADEPSRLGYTRHRRVTRRFPLAELGVTVDDVAAFWKSMPFDLELPTDMGRNYAGNCTGCFLKSELDLALLCRNDPEEFSWWEGLEARSGSTFKKGWSYADLRRRVESGDSDRKFGTEGYFCQASGGECTGEGDY